MAWYFGWRASYFPSGFTSCIPSSIPSALSLCSGPQEANFPSLHHLGSLDVDLLSSAKERHLLEMDRQEEREVGIGCLLWIKFLAVSVSFHQNSFYPIRKGPVPVSFYSTVSSFCSFKPGLVMPSNYASLWVPWHTLFLVAPIYLLIFISFKFLFFFFF